MKIIEIDRIDGVTSELIPELPYMETVCIFYSDRKNKEKEHFFNRNLN